MSHPVWHEYLKLVSFFASVLGLYLVGNRKSKNDADAADQTLFALSFAYWIVHLVAVSAQKWISPDWLVFTLSLKWTAVLSYLLTFSCALSLPMHTISASQRQTE
ncbi:hypothetical protein [Myxacorys almedinensis]|uniref:Uncharacterized protein n=1 Tax=Myxacorys almedinensis A TaxID=2690445 RepID=A0A8J8CLI7_9CYAN|nr:hypothetical protein [Myxacorys almedinensis]NDJ17795.1 hypothetical protein [Myxacorys almedinensis A]